MIICLNSIFFLGFRKAIKRLDHSQILPPLNNDFCMFAAKKRFYKDVSVVSSGGDYEITLDSKKLKTPGGSVMTLGNQSLALAVAHEWQAQRDQILLSQMHLTGLCNTAIDNPTNATKYDLVDDILNFLDTDTLLFFAEVRVS